MYIYIYIYTILIQTKSITIFQEISTLKLYLTTSHSN